jgi:predicted acylesterase/phospholipase RssA
MLAFPGVSALAIPFFGVFILRLAAYQEKLTMNWNQIGRALRTVFLLRVPLLTLVVLAGFGPFALVSAEKLLGNLFDLRVPGATVWTAWYLFSAAFAAFTLAWTAVAVINLVLYYGRDRFEDPALNLGQKRPGATFLLGLLSALFLVSCTILRTPMHPLLRYGMPLLGLLCSLAMVILAKVIQLTFTDPRTTPHPPPYLVFPAYILPAIEHRFDRLYCWRPPRLDELKACLNGVSQWLLEIFRCAGQGYLVSCEAPVDKLMLRSGHVFAIGLSLIALTLYLIIGFFKSRIDLQPSVVPALSFVLLFLIVACWFLGAITFFFDRYRVPLLACLAALSLITTYAPQSDHFYRVVIGQGPPALLKPSQLIADRATRAHRRLIAVATAGGGIQAAAWTARVLRGLEEACLEQEYPAAKCDLRNSVVVISGVSGGSLGAMAYARSFTNQPSQVSPASVVTNAEASAIDEVAWGWTNPDIFRAILPWFRRRDIDRGWALEEKWNAIHELRDGKGGRDVLLGDWAPTAGNSMPALLLNATLVESGAPLVFSTTDFPHENDHRDLTNFYDLYPSLKKPYDIRVNTAARLSASFPYVAPAARSDAMSPELPDYHVVDGGYYDNFGMVALLGWLENAIEDSSVSQQTQDEVKSDLADVLVLEIRPFPTSGGAVSGKPHGWGFQLVAPMDGLLDVRDTGQFVHDDTEFSLFSRNYRRQHINVWRADFVYPSDFGEEDRGCLEAPLSWKLSLDQLGCIEKGWQRLRAREQGSAVRQGIGCVMNFLNPAADPGMPSPQSGLCRAGDEPYQ